jgi:hypothetical protein
MTAEDIAGLDKPNDYRKRKTVMDDYLNIIYKMHRDKINPEVIISYVIKSGYNGNLITLESYIRLMGENNFNKRVSRNWAYDFSYSDDVTIIKRNELLKYITTKSPKTKKSEVLSRNFEVIKEKYSIVAVIKEIYDEFYDILMGKSPDKIDTFISKYKDSVIQGFVEGILYDITAVKNAVSYDESNGFVEGNNNKFKLIKRLLYGRAKLTNLFKKSYLAFKFDKKDFEFSRLF